MKLLLVDDIVVNRFIIREIVKKLGHDFLEADNGLAAINLLENNDIDLIFMDIEMPVMNGLETAKYIRTKFKYPKKDVKIYALTAYNPSILHEEIDVTVFNGVITKPYSSEKIKSLLESF